MLTFVHISDTHISHDPAYTYFNADYPSHPGALALVQAVNALPFPVDFVLHTGDVAYDPDERAYSAAQMVLSAIRFPVHYMVGNHDSGAHLLQTFGTPSAYYEFEAKGVQIVCLDSSTPAIAAGAKPPAGYIDEAQLAWLAGVARPDDSRPLVVAIHHNVLKTGIAWLDEYMGMVNGDALHRALLPLRGRLRGVFHGHIHMNLDTVQDGILYASTCSSWYQLHAYPGLAETSPDRGAEPGFSVVTVNGGQMLVRRYRFPAPTG